MNDPLESELLDEAKQLAALDLGSNSFHLIVAVERDGHLQVVDKLKEMVRLADGINKEHNLDKEVAERALACLERYGQRLRGLKPENIRIVGTNTLRIASEAKSFLKRAEAALGSRIDIISGREEARLIYLGVAHALEDNYQRRLVIDIGGGSTELIIGRHFEPEILESLHMGCVGLSKAYFSNKKITGKAFNGAYKHALNELAPIRDLFLEADWETAIGASGTILAVDSILQQQSASSGGITRDGLHQLKAQILKTSQIDQLKLPGLSTERTAVFPAGVALLLAIMDSLEIPLLIPSQGALREGLLYDLIGSNQQHDVRERATGDLLDRFHIDIPHAERVEQMAIHLLEELADSWQLTDASYKRLLGWAARLHEIGMNISHSQYHKHGAYLLQNLDIPGFSQSEQAKLAALVRVHRRKWPKEEMPAGDEEKQALRRLSVILRLAVLLRRSRRDVELPPMRITAKGDKVRLHVPESWQESHPLTQMDLEHEAAYLDNAGIKLIIDNKVADA